MPECKCPNCKTNFRALSSDFGEMYHCNTCSHEFKLNIEHLARYKLPNLLQIQLQNPDGTPFTRFRVPVMIHYGYSFPPLRSDFYGKLLVTRDMFSKAEQDEISTGIMDHKGDYSLTRYITINVHSRVDAILASERRANSNWSISSFEKELYGDMASVVNAYKPDEEVKPVSLRIDLSEEKNIFEAMLVINQ